MAQGPSGQGVSLVAPVQVGQGSPHQVLVAANTTLWFGAGGSDRPERNNPPSAAEKLHVKLLTFQLVLQIKISAELVWGGANAHALRQNKGTLAFSHGLDNLLNVREMADYHTHL